MLIKVQEVSNIYSRWYKAKWEKLFVQ